MKIPEVISREIIYNNSWRKIILKTLKIKTGEKQQYPINSHVWEKYATMIFPITQDWDVVYCKEWRPWIEDFVYSFPVWMQETELSFRENAIKELEEEVWCLSDNISSLWETIASNFDSTIIKFFFAASCTLWKNNLEDWEYIEVQKCSLVEFEQKIISWEINCPLTISCYTKAKLQKLI